MKIYVIYILCCDICKIQCWHPCMCMYVKNFLKKNLVVTFINLSFSVFLAIFYSSIVRKFTGT